MNQEEVNQEIIIGEKEDMLDKSPEFEEDNGEEEGGQGKNRVLVVTSIVVAVLICFGIVSLFGAQHTAYVSVDINKIVLDEIAYKGSSYMLSSLDGSKIPMTAARVSGQVIGNGSVKIYLNTGEERLLMYSNEKKKFNVPPITGFSVYDERGVDNESSLAINAEGARLLEDNTRVLSGIKIGCLNNPEGMYVEVMNVSWKPDNGERLVGIRIDNKDFWGYGKAGNPMEPQPSGVKITGWGQKIDDSWVNTITTLEFNSDMSGKELTMDIFFNDYLPGFKLGSERQMRLYLDLEGLRESYVEEVGKPQKKSIFWYQFADKGSQPSTGTGDKGVSPGGETAGLGNGSGTGSSVTGPEKGEGAGIVNGTKQVNQISPSRYDEIVERPDGTVLKSRIIEPEAVRFLDRQLALKVEIIEDPRYKKVFEDNKPEGYVNVSYECAETCFIEGKFASNKYNFTFDVEEGTAINVTEIVFS